MTHNELVSTIRKWRGTIYVELMGRDDPLWIKAVKSDLLAAIEHIADHQLDATVTNGALYVGRAY